MFIWLTADEPGFQLDGMYARHVQMRAAPSAGTG